MYCNKCGTYLSDDVKFCSKCGTKVPGQEQKINSDNEKSCEEIAYQLKNDGFILISDTDKAQEWKNFDSGKIIEVEKLDGGKCKMKIEQQFSSKDNKNSKESILKFLFSPKGRINRKMFLLGPHTAINSLIFTVFIILDYFKLSSNVLDSIMGVSFIFILYTTIIVTIKRMHDMNKNGFWAIIPLLTNIGMLWPMIGKTVEEANKYGTNPLLNLNNKEIPLVTKLFLPLLFIVFFIFIYFTIQGENKLKEATNAYENKEYKMAAKLLQESCEYGNHAGCNDLGYMYLNGVGIEQDYTKAFYLFQKECDSKNMYGCSNLGYMYENGLGVNRDFLKAIELHKKACDGGEEWSCKQLDRLNPTEAATITPSE